MKCRKWSGDQNFIVKRFGSKNRNSYQPNRLTEQISQHYIYNSLQIIAGMCDTDPAKAKETIVAFADYLRVNLENVTEDRLISFDREVEHTKVFLALEKLAGVHDFEIEYRLGATDFMMPPLVLQPIVENAVKYGAGRNGEPCRIVIETNERAGEIVIEVTNTASERLNMSEAPKSRRSVALDNVRARLARQCGGAVSLNTSGDETKAIITIPKRTVAS